jgi:hypothetical protein
MLKKVKKIMFVVILLVFSFEVYLSIISAYSLREQNFYPVQAVKYLSKQNLIGNVFSLYDYGGYLIWKLPAKKVFIDGRMPSWRRPGYFPNESNYAFKDYLKMLSNDSFFKKMLQKYNIRYVLLPVTKTAKKKKIAFLVKIENYLKKFEFWQTNSKVINEDLRKIGMQEVYNDGKFVIYKK